MSKCSCIEENVRHKKLIRLYRDGYIGWTTYYLIIINELRKIAKEKHHENGRELQDSSISRRKFQAA